MAVDAVEVEPDDFLVKIAGYAELRAVPEFAVIFGAVHVLDVVAEIGVFLQSGFHIGRKDGSGNDGLDGFGVMVTFLHEREEVLHGGAHFGFGYDGPFHPLRAAVQAEGLCGGLHGSNRAPKQQAE